MKKELFCVLTGDVISSSSMNRDVMLEVLKEALKQVESQEVSKNKQGFELYRGDSFQGFFSKPEEALKYAIIIRAHLKKMAKSEEKDARIAIGIGEISYRAKSIAESDGDAFRNSGPVLDEMKNGAKIRLKSPWKEVDEEMEVSLALADVIISRWSSSQAEVIEESLYNKKQAEIALKLGVSQSAVNQRLQAAQWEIIEKLIQRFKALILQYSKK